jgi:hypothetical protein
MAAATRNKLTDLPLARKSREPASRPDDDERTILSVRITNDHRRRLRRLAADRSVTLQKLIDEAIGLLLQRARM